MPKRFPLAAILLLPALLLLPASQAQTLSLDPAYGADGISETVFMPGSTSPGLMAVDSQGRVVVASTYELFNQNYVAVSRLNADGTRDVDFGENGRAVEQVRRARLVDMGLDASDRTVLLGTYRPSESGELRPFAIRLSPDGTLDTDFGGGSVRFPLLAVGEMKGMAVLDDGSFAAGFVLEGGDNCGLFRVNAAGNLDSFFGDGGVAFTPGGGIIPCGPGAVMLDAAGNYYYGGYKTYVGSGQDMVLVRFVDDGILDLDFASRGVVTIDYEEFSDRIQHMAFDASGRIVLAGQTVKGSTRGALVVRLMPDGSLDPTFGADGFTWTAHTYDEDESASFVGMALDDESRPVLLYGSVEPALARLTTNGSLDETASPDGSGILTLDLDPASNYAGYMLSVEVTNGAPYVMTRFLTTSSSSAYAASRFTEVPVSSEAALASTMRLTSAPNPTRGRTDVRLDLAAPADAEVSVYDVLGRRVATLHDGPAAVGELRATWEASGVAPGAYIVVARVGDAVTTRRVSVVR